MLYDDTDTIPHTYPMHASATHRPPSGHISIPDHCILHYRCYPSLPLFSQEHSTLCRLIDVIFYNHQLSYVLLFRCSPLICMPCRRRMSSFFFWGGGCKSIVLARDCRTLLQNAHGRHRIQPPPKRTASVLPAQVGGTLSEMYSESSSGTITGRVPPAGATHGVWLAELHDQ